MVYSRRKSTAALLSVISNATLVVLKLAIGFLIGSVAVISEAAHSGVDLVAALIALFAVTKAGKPADEVHPYGHGKVENISGTIEALLIFAAAIWIVYEAIHKLLRPQSIEHLWWGVLVMLVSSVANMIVSARLFKVAEETDSVALHADAWHLRTDVYTSVGVMVGLGIVLAGRRLFPSVDLRWIDPAAALVVAVLILRAAYSLTVASARDLLDVSLPLEEEKWIREYMAGLRVPVCGFHQLRTRKAGSYRFVEVHLIVESQISVARSHAIGDAIEAEIRRRFPDSNVTVHVEPCEGECAPKCAAGCLLSDDQRRAARERRAAGRQQATLP